MSLKQVNLEDKYRAETGSVVINGAQALLLAMMRQRRFDRARNLHTAGFLSGYRGSPLASVDTEAWAAEEALLSHDVRFQPGINEDLALTSVWGTQQLALDPLAKVKGVFAMWYGKGAGLDRCGDALRHAHGAGASRHGGVLVVCGDDHALKSSSQAYHSEPTFIDLQMPVLYPADLQEMLDFAILGWEMSRYSGCYVGFKVLAEHANSTGVVDVGLERVQLVSPTQLPIANDRWIRWPDPWPDVEQRIHSVKLPAALEFARANTINKVVIAAKTRRLGVVVAGKSWRDLQQALALIEVSPDHAASLGVSVLKVGMPWPADEIALKQFCDNQEAILVIEEKRDLIESQVRNALHRLSPGARQPVLGCFDRNGHPLLPRTGELGPHAILRALSPEIRPLLDERRQLLLDAVLDRACPSPDIIAPRAPYFCSGCPHNSSTRVPEGSRALGGVGCHFMATGMDRNTDTFTQMGGEGAPWIGTAPFTATPHMFVNLGEGTYFHSGSLAIRAARAAGVNVTYKILYNDAIAMTGGQPVDGQLSVADIVAQVAAEGVEHIEIVADDPQRHLYPRTISPRWTISGRDDLMAVQARLRDMPGVSVLIYDQTCATEKRRRRKRGLMPKAQSRVIINDRVCEGCGDCSVQSNCLSIVPLETEYGRKRTIDQSNCNQDYSCINGFCPSFVQVEGAALRKPTPLPLTHAELPEPPLPRADDGSYDILLAGIGGSGVVTISAVLGMAAHLDGKHFTIHDKLGMAQKYGAVSSHLRIAAHKGSLDSVRIAPGKARVLIASDLRVAAERSVLDLVSANEAALVVARDQGTSGEFARDGDFDFQSEALESRLRAFAPNQADLISARALARDLLGDEIGANFLLVGHAWQKGLVPISREALLRAIELNGVAVALNKRAFELGRRHACGASPLTERTHEENTRNAAELPWNEIRDRRAIELRAYQDDRYAARYLRLVADVASAETRLLGAAGQLTRAVAVSFAKLMAYKDEYEVARLYTDGVFADTLAQTFESGARPSFYFAPPLFATRDPHTGLPRKRRYGAWMLGVLHVLAKGKHLRGTVFDLFGLHPERREERRLIDQYEKDLMNATKALTHAAYAHVLALAALPQIIRGYGHVKMANLRIAENSRVDLLTAIVETDSYEPAHAR